MKAISVPWEWVAKFLSTRETLRLRAAAVLFNTESLCGEFGPLLFFLFQCMEVNSTTARPQRPPDSRSWSNEVCGLTATHLSTPRFHNGQVISVRKEETSHHVGKQGILYVCSRKLERVLTRG